MTESRARLASARLASARLARSAAATAALITAALVAAPDARAAGILPPNNPPADIPAAPADPGNVCPDNVAGASSYLPCVELQLEQIDNARAREGVGPMKIPADYTSLTPAEQLFEIIGQERVGRGLNAPVGMYSTYDQAAAVGAQTDTDPPLLDGSLYGIHAAGGGTMTALLADYLFMYDDGPGGFNADCTTANPGGCWAHRDAILANFGPALYAGSAFAATTAYPASFSWEGAPKPSGTLDFAFQPGTLVPPAPSICDRVLGSGVVGMAETAGGGGYWIADGGGAVSDCGTAPDLGRPPASTGPGSAISAIASTPDGKGFWAVTRSGTVYHFGDAAFHGDLSGIHLDGAIVAMAADPATGGYWLLGSDGGIFSFDAPFHGSAGATDLSAPAVGITALPDGTGYRIVAADGGVFDYGSAVFRGSTGGIHLDQPVVQMAADPATGGYWLLAADGGIFSFDAPFYGSTGATHLSAPAVGITALPDGTGYRMVAADGGVFDFGRAAFDGSAA